MTSPAPCAFHAIRTSRWAVLAVTSIILTPLFGLILGSSAAIAVPWLMTLHLLLLGITLIVLEFSGRRGAPRLGAALLCVLLIARMFESELSLLAKGLAFNIAKDSKLLEGQYAYALLQTGADGQTTIQQVSAEPPTSGDYVRVTYRWESADKAKVTWPFDRFYLNEALAPEADKWFAESIRDILKERVKPGKP